MFFLYFSRFSVGETKRRRMRHHKINLSVFAPMVSYYIAIVSLLTLLRSSAAMEDLSTIGAKVVGLTCRHSSWHAIRQRPIWFAGGDSLRLRRFTSKTVLPSSLVSRCYECARMAAYLKSFKSIDSHVNFK